LNQDIFKIIFKGGKLQIPGTVFDNNKTKEKIKGNNGVGDTIKWERRRITWEFFETFTCGRTKTLPKNYPFSFTKLPITPNTRISILPL